MSTIAIAILVLLALGSASGYLNFHGDLVLAEANRHAKQSHGSARAVTCPQLLGSASLVMILQQLLGIIRLTENPKKGQYLGRLT
jgi:hypothetical protein